jgi:hypothetical protein
MKNRIGKIITAFALSAAFVLGLLISAAPVDAQAKALTEEEKTKFAEYINGSMHSSIAKFNLYDVNNDGRKDLVILDYGNGIMQYTTIYMHIGSSYKEVYFDGEMTSYGKKGVKAVYGMTNGMTGTVASTETTVYNISKKGKLTTKLVQTKDNINNSSTYKVNGKKSNAKKYKAALKKYSFTKVKWKDLNDDNIKKYINT